MTTSQTAKKSRRKNNTPLQFPRRRIRGQTVAARFVRLFREIAALNLPVVVYLRVSWVVQDKDTKSLRDQKRRVLRELKSYGVKIVAVIEEIGSGKLTHPKALVTRKEMARMARKHGAIVVAESVSRFLRGKNYSGRKKDPLPTIQEWRELSDLMFNVPLVTLEDPEISFSKERSMQVKRGHAEKKAKPGRPRKTIPGSKKQTKANYEAMAKRLHFRCGISYRKIAQKLNIPHSTIAGWFPPEIDVRISVSS